MTFDVSQFGVELTIAIIGPSEYNLNGMISGKKQGTAMQAGMNKKKTRKVIIVHLGMLAGAIVLVYANSLKGAFLYDDLLLVVNNYYLRSWHNLGRIFTSTLFAGAGHASVFYRPLQVLSLLADYSVWKLNPIGYHLTGIFFHFLTAALFYFLAREITVEEKTALLAGLLFAVHPVHTEAVTYVAGRSDPMAAAFALLALLAFSRSFSDPGSGKRKGLFYGAALISYLLSLLGRETMLVFPFALILYQAAFPGRKEKSAFSGKKILIRTAPFFLLAAGYLLWRKQVLAGFIPNPSILSRTPPVLRMFTAAEAVFLYLGLLALPFGLHMERNIPVVKSVLELPGVFSVAAVVILLAVAFRFRRRAGLIFFGVSWFFLFLVPVSNVVPLNATMAEHWLYFPSLGVFLLAAVPLARLPGGGPAEKGRQRLKAPGIAVAVLLLGCYGALTVRQNEYWRDEIAFYERTLEFSPGNSRMHNNLGEAYTRKGEHARAVAEYLKSIAIKPDSAPVYNNLGVSYQETGKLTEAEAAFQKALALKPDYADAHINMGRLYLAGGEADRAWEEFGEAVKINPLNPAAHYQLGIACLRRQRVEEAVGEFRRALEIDPGYVLARLALGDVCLQAGRYQEARGWYEAAERADPAAARARLGVVAYNQGNRQEARRWFRLSLESKPVQPEIHVFLGNIYLLENATEKAAAEYRQALVLDPASAAALNGLGYLYVEKGIDVKAGVEMLEKAVTLAPDKAAYLDSLGWAYYRQGRLAIALERLNQAAGLNPTDPYIKEHLETVKGESKK